MVYLFTGGVSNAMAAEYLRRQGISHGWASNDADNAVGPNAVFNSRLYNGMTPYVAVIRASDMTVYDHDDIWTSHEVDIPSVAQELSDQ